MYYIFIYVLLYQGKVINVSNEYIVCMIAILLQNYKKKNHYLFIAWYVYTQEHAHSFVIIQPKKKIQKKTKNLQKKQNFLQGFLRWNFQDVFVLYSQFSVSDSYYAIFIITGVRNLNSIPKKFSVLHLTCILFRCNCIMYSNTTYNM